MLILSVSFLRLSATCRGSWIQIPPRAGFKCANDKGNVTLIEDVFQNEPVTATCKIPKVPSMAVFCFVAVVATASARTDRAYFLKALYLEPNRILYAMVKTKGEEATKAKTDPKSIISISGRLVTVGCQC